MEREYTDAELLLMYREFSEEYYRASFYSPVPETIVRFRRWITEEWEPEHAALEDYERDMLRMYHESAG